MRVLHASLITLLFTLTSSIPVYAAGISLSDIRYHLHRQDIESLVEKNIIHGYGDSTFKPHLPINRAEFLKILTLAVFGKDAYSPSDTRCFRDFTGDELWFYPLVCSAKEAKVIDGYPDGTFRGEQAVNSAEAVKMAVEAWGIATDQSNGPWYEKYLSIAKKRDLDNLISLSPAHILLRGEAAALIVNFREDVLTVAEGKTSSSVSSSSSSSSSTPALIIIPSPTKEPAKPTYSEPIRHAFIKIEQKGLADTRVSEGTNDILLLSFRVSAARQDASLNSLTLKATAGSLQTIQNIRILADENGDGTFLKFPAEIKKDGTILQIDGLNLPVYDGVEGTIEIYADSIHNPANPSIALEFDTSSTAYISGVGREDGRELDGITTNGTECSDSFSVCWISVTTAQIRTVTITMKGNLFVTSGSIPIPNRQILLGALTDTLLRVRFRAENEDIEVSQLSFEGGTSSISHLELLKAGSTVSFANAFSSGCGAVSSDRFCVQFPSNTLVIERDQEKEILVRAKLKANTDGGVSGESIALSLTASTLANVRAVDARGLSSDENLVQNDADTTLEGEILIGRNTVGANSSIAGSTHDTVASKISSIANSHPDPDNSNIPVGIANIGQFRFASPTHINTFGGTQKSTIRSMIFTVSALNVRLDQNGFSLYNKENAQNTHTCNANGSTGTITVTCSALNTSSVSTDIIPGASIDLVLQGSIEDPSVAGGTSTLQVQLTTLNNRNTTGSITWDDGTTVFSWIDIKKNNVRSVQFK